MIERLYKSVIDLAKTFALNLKKQPDRLSKSAALDTLVSITLNNAFLC